MVNSLGSASYQVNLPTSPGRVYAQWVEWDYRNDVFKLTQGAEIKY